MNIKIIKALDAQKPFVIIDKPSGLPSAPLSADDKNNAFYEAASLYPKLLDVKGKKEIEHGLLHRLDTATSGLMIIAASQECYDFLQKEQQEGKIIKYYRAQCNVLEPVNDKKEIEVESYFRPFGPGRKEVRPVTEASGKAALQKLGKKVLYKTFVKILSYDKEKKIAEVECKILNGYRHQVRCHLAWIGLPVVNDKIYNPLVKKENAEPMRFCACKLEFEYPRGDLNSYDRKDTWT